jgi:hypothetical protein
MKKLMTIVALTASVISAPAFAETPATAYRAVQPWSQDFAQGYQSIAQTRNGTAIKHTDNVYDSRGFLVGADPDPNVRMQLHFDRSGSD